MPPTNDSKHRHARKTSSTPRKSKPKFEIPAESSVPESAAGWVYRADEVPEPPRIEGTNTASAGQATIEETSSTNPLLVVGMGLFFIGLGTMGVLSMAALGAMAAPFRLTRRLFSE
jgi:hypothetical protein